MSRYDWLKTEVGLIPRRKFHVFESQSLAELKAVEDCYERLPVDYREFVETFGQAKLFRDTRNPWYNLLVLAPPKIKDQGNEPVRIKLGYYANTGSAWLESSDGSALEGAPVFSGFSWRRRKTATCFEEWLKRSCAAAKKLYSKPEWTALLKPVPPFTAREQQIVEAIPKFMFRKVGVTPGGNLLIEIENKSLIQIPHLTVGVRDETSESTCALLVAGLVPGASMTIERSVQAGAMDPHRIALFRLPVPDPEDRPYFYEFRDFIS